MFYVCAILELLPAVAIHELGHALAASLLGLQVTSLRIGPFNFGGKGSRPTSSDLLGFITVRPKKFSRVGRRMFWMFAAGPAANLLTFIAIVFFTTIIPFSISWHWRSSFIGSFAVVSLYLGVNNMRPGATRTGMVRDGTRLLTLRSMGAQKRRFLALQGLSMLRERGAPVKSMNRRWVRTALAPSDSSHDCLAANLIAYIVALSHEEVPDAAGFLERGLELSSKLRAEVRSFYAFEAAFFQAWHRENIQNAETWLKRAKNLTQITPLMHIRLAIALNAARSQFDEALAEWDKGMQVINEMPSCDQRAALESSWKEWRDDLEVRKNRPSMAIPALTATVGAPISRS